VPLSRRPDHAQDDEPATALVDGASGWGIERLQDAVEVFDQAG
jgi:hypothetical protein